MAKEIQKKEEEKKDVEEKKSLGKYVVVYDKIDRLWKIKRDGAKRVIDSKVTKEEALKRVKELSLNNDVGFVAKKKDGKFQKKKNIKV